MTSISKHRILVVDDDPDILNIIKHDFAPFSVEVVTCLSVEEALEKLGNEMFTLAILDIVMGQGISSERIIQFVKEDFAGENRDLPVAIISAHMHEDYARKLRLKGSNVFATFKKPLKIKQFASQILGEGQRSILLLEDDNDIVTLIKNELEQNDFQIFCCRNTDLAQRVVDLVSINLLVVDNKLGVGKDSREFIDYIEKYHHGLPIILSGKDIPEDLEKNEYLNLIGILKKPFQKGLLLQQINDYLSDNEQVSSTNIYLSGHGEGNINEDHNLISGEALEDQDELHTRVTGGPIEDHGEQHTRVTGGPIEDHGEGYSRVKSNESGIISEELTVVSGDAVDDSTDILRVKSLVKDSPNEDIQDLSKGDINHRNKNGQTPLMIFCYLGEFEKVKAVISDGADLNLKSKNRKTCLHYAAFSGNTDLFSYLVQHHGMRINERDGMGCTPILDAIKTGNLSMVRSCVELGARLTFFLEGRSYLTFAILYGHADIAKYLIDLGLDRNKKDYKSLSPLDYALKSGKKEMITLMKSE